MNQNNGVLILAERRGQDLARVSAELITAGRKIADDLGEELAALLVGEELAENAQELLKMGAQKVYTVEGGTFAQYNPEAYLPLMSQACEQLQPRVVLMGHSEIGRDLAPRLAFALDTGFAPNCVRIEADKGSGTITVTRPAFGGKAHGLFTLGGTSPQVITVGPKVFEPAEAKAMAEGEIATIVPTVDPATFKTSVVDRIEEGAEGIKLEDATFVVSGGRGIGGAEGFAQLKELANALGGAVGASRVPVDNGWTPSSLQVGLTGTVVSPNVYVAVAISGAAQHMAGCSSSKTIIAINRDIEAPIFQRAHYGAVADWREVVPLLIEKCRAM